MTRRQLLSAFLFTAVSILALGAQEGQSVKLGTLSTGATISFVGSNVTGWGMVISGTPQVVEEKPARVEVYTDAKNIKELTAGYKTVSVAGGVATAEANLASDSGATFHVVDRWTISGAVASVHRKVEVQGNAAGGFSSAVMLRTKPDVNWYSTDFFAPGLLYADPTNDGARGPGGPLNFGDHRLSFREDWLSAPLMTLSFRNGTSIAVLDPKPAGDTTTLETHTGTDTAMTDEHFKFGALGAHDSSDGGVEFGFWLPGTISDYAGPPRSLTPDARRPDPTDPPVRAWRRRYNPIKQGFTQEYDVSFRLGKGEAEFRDVTKATYRWAWATLNPQVTYIDLAAYNKVLVDFLATRALTIDGRTGWPYLVNTHTGEYLVRSDAKRAALGFCAKNIEAADQLLEEADHDSGPRGQNMRKIGLDTISTMIRMLGPMSPPVGDGYDLYTGQLIQAAWSENKQFLRTPNDDLLALMRAYNREKAHGRNHPEWVAWVKSYCDWMLTQQRADGSWPRTWIPGTNNVAQPSGSGTFSPPPLLLAMYKETGDAKYKESAIRAGEYLWSDWGVRGIYAGGAVDGSSVHLTTDKEAGMLSLLAFESIYDATKDPKWLERAKSAGDYAESWIWIWNVPMPLDGNDSTLEWKRDKTTVGLQGIGAGGGGGTDEYLDWATSLYAKLYVDTKDPHYLDVTRILLHNTKAMVAMPGHLYEMLGPGWQQEHWGMQQNRGYGQYGKWLPWTATNHIHSIVALQDDYPALYKQIAAPPVESSSRSK
jgi:hypothetical protein